MQVLSESRARNATNGEGEELSGDDVDGEFNLEAPSTSRGET